MWDQLYESRISSGRACRGGGFGHVSRVRTAFADAPRGGGGRRADLRWIGQTERPLRRPIDRLTVLLLFFQNHTWTLWG